MHRNSQKRYNLENEIYFTVSKTDKNFPYFKEPLFCELLIEVLSLCKLIKQFRLIAFSIIYDHLNLIIQPNGDCNLSKVMQFIKRNTSRNINYIISSSTEGDINKCRLRREEYKQYENQINEFIKILNNLKKQFIQKYGSNQTQFPKFRWQKSFRDHLCRDDQDLQNHYTYTAYNYLKHGLPENWQYTSLNYPDLID